MAKVISMQGYVAMARFAITLIAVVALAHAAGRLALFGLEAQLEAEQPRALSPLASPVTRATQSISARKIQSWHLFGQVLEDKPVLASAPVDAPETQLKLVLKSVLTSDVPGGGSAIIGEQNKLNSDDVYRQGDTVPGGAIVDMILQDRVLLRRNGKLETLWLEGSRPDSLSTLVATGGEQLDYRNDAEVTTLLTDYRRRLLANPLAYNQVIKLQPQFNSQGQMTAVVINPGSAPGDFARLGLKPGDTVTGVNGIQIADPNKGTRIVDALRSDGDLSLDLVRGGQTVTLQFSVNDLAPREVFDRDGD